MTGLEHAASDQLAGGFREGLETELAEALAQQRDRRSGIGFCVFHGLRFPAVNRCAAAARGMSM